jgi:hypothetical protein
MAGTPRTRAVSGEGCALPRRFNAAAVQATLAMLAAIGPQTYTDVQWNVTTHGSYRRLVRLTGRQPPTPDPCLSVLR